MANLFQQGDFTLHSGEQTEFLIDCASGLASHDWKSLAKLVSERFNFGWVYGIPRGGEQFAKALRPYEIHTGQHPSLLVDDVLTTGTSMNEMRQRIAGDVIGVVAFARGECPDWIHPIFRMW